MDAAEKEPKLFMHFYVCTQEHKADILPLTMAGGGDGEAFRAAGSRAHFPFSAAQLLLKCAPCITQAEPAEQALRPLRPS